MRANLFYRLRRNARRCPEEVVLKLVKSLKVVLMSIICGELFALGVASLALKITRTHCPRSAAESLAESIDLVGFSIVH